MNHDHQLPTVPALLRPLNIDVATVAQPDARSPRQGCDQSPDNFLVPIPGGASILMKDSAGTSMSLNLDIDPSSGTPILSGRAINSQGDVLDVHPCGCNDPVASRHALPLRRSPKLSHSGAHALDASHMYPSPRSPYCMPPRPTPIFTHTPTPLVLVQTRLPQSPSAIESQQKSEEPAPGTYVDPLITPTPASMRRNSQSSGTGDTFHTPQTSSEETSTPSPAALDSLEPSQEAPPSPRNVPPRLNTLPMQPPLDLDFDTPLVQSPSSSGFSGPSAFGPLPSLPNSPTYSASMHSARAVTPRSRRVIDIMIPQDSTTLEPTVSLPSSHRATSQDDDGTNVAKVTLPDRPEENMPSVDDDTAGTREQDVPPTPRAATNFLDLDLASHVQRNANLSPDLYAGPVAAAPPMPTANIGPDSLELRYDLTRQLGFGCLTVRFYVLALVCLH
jgi:hypothetical protein